jgi:hypothetical protein
MIKLLQSRFPRIFSISVAAAFCLMVSTSSNAAPGSARPVQQNAVKVQKKAPSRWHKAYKKVTAAFGFGKIRTQRQEGRVDVADTARAAYVAAKGKALKSNIVSEKGKNFDQHATSRNINPQPVAPTTAPPQAQPSTAGTSLLTVQTPAPGPVKSFLPPGGAVKVAVQPDF